MLLDNPIASYATAAWFARLIGLFRGVNAFIDMIAMTRALCGDVPNRTFKESDANGPAWYAFHYNNVGYVVIDGATTLTQIQRLVDGYTGNLNAFVNEPTNDYLNAAARNIVQRLVDFNLTGVAGWRVVGYSLGGAIAPLLNFNFLNDMPRPVPMDVLTFGAPRSCAVTLRRLVNARANVVRMMMPGDPIPLCPPRTAEFVPLPAVIGVRAALRWQQFLHCGGGCVLNTIAPATPDDVPPDGVIGMATNLASWMWSLMSGSITEHSIIRYEGRLDSYAAIERLRPVPEVSPPEQPGDMNRQHTQRAQAQGEAVLVHREQQLTRLPTVIPPNDKFKHERVGKVHLVTFRGKVIATGTRKRKAMGVANDLNDMLKRLQTTGLVDPPALIQSLQTYLDEATDPAGGFVPVMSTSWNEGFR